MFPTDDEEDDGEVAGLLAGDGHPPGQVVPLAPEAGEDKDVHDGEADEGDDAGEEESEREEIAGRTLDWPLIWNGRRILNPASQELILSADNLGILDRDPPDGS